MQILSSLFNAEISLVDIYQGDFRRELLQRIFCGPPVATLRIVMSIEHCQHNSGGSKERKGATHSYDQYSSRN